jgi:hypothetical protein
VLLADGDDPSGRAAYGRCGDGRVFGVFASRRKSFFFKRKAKDLSFQYIRRGKNKLYKQTQLEKLNNKDLDRTLTLKENDQKNPPTGTPAATDGLHLHQ